MSRASTNREGKSWRGTCRLLQALLPKPSVRKSRELSSAMNKSRLSYPPRTAPFCRENDSLTAPTSTYKAGRRTFLKYQLRHFSSQSLYGYIAMLHLKFWGLFCFPDIFTGKEVKRVVQKEKRTHYVHIWEDGSVGRVSAVQA